MDYSCDQRPILIAELIKKSASLDSNISSWLNHIFATTDFKNCKSRNLQILTLKDYGRPITYSLISQLFGISKGTIFKISNHSVKELDPNSSQNSEEIPKNKSKIMYNRNLTIEEEELILKEINDAQSQMACLEPKDIKKRASDLYTQRTGEVKVFDKSWWRRFHGRHKEVLGVETVSGLEEDRGNVQAQKVYEYYKDLENLLNLIEDPRQLINIDEEGIGSRPKKGKRKKVVFMKSNPQKPFFREETDVSHISIVGAINRNDQIHPLMILGKQEIDETNVDIAMRRSSFHYFQTGTGYATIESTLFFVQNILEPYIHSVRNEKENPTLPFILIMDGLPAHKNANVTNAINKIGNIHVRFIPPHSSHFLQPLDLFYFLQHKKLYLDALSLSQGSKRNSTASQAFNEKVVRVLDTWEAIQRKYVNISWKRAFIELVIESPDDRIFFFFHKLS